MSSQKFVRKEVLPLKWCEGCGLYQLFYSLNDVLEEKNLDNSVIISGIGCTGRGAGFFNLDSIHGLHGRAIPLAVGVKMANEKLNVIVFSGDGDLLGIGGNHLIHAARRNDNITVICNRNEVFAMTGRQTAPTTKKGEATITDPEGNPFDPINAQGIITSNQKYFYGRVSPMNREHMKKVLKEAIEHEGFSFIEVMFKCVIDYEKKTGKGIADLYKEQKIGFKVVEENRILKDDEIGVIKK